MPPNRRMLRRGPGVLITAAVLVLTAGTASAATAPAAAPPPRSAPAARSAPADLPPTSSAAGQVTTRHACDVAPLGRARCLAIIDGQHIQSPQRKGTSAATESGPHALTAADLQAAYRLPSALLGARQTIAIVDAFDNPSAEQDLANYRAANGLPACDDNFPCFRKVDQRGGTDYPPPDSGWGLEIDLDLQMASAACPNCRLLLVEADDNSLDNLAAAVDEAVKLGADVVSNSYGTAGEFSTELDYARHYNHPGTVITASSGDSGFGVSVPAVFDSVVAVGGTTLFPDGGGWSETAWAGAGSGCSAYVAKPSWQRDPLCDRRAVADVAAVADPATPVAVFDTFGFDGWVGVGGTSVASPLVAGVYALAGNTGTIDPDAYLYSQAGKLATDHRANLIDITSGFEGFPGSNGFCGGGYLCAPGGGYDGPTGLGTPNSLGAF